MKSIQNTNLSCGLLNAPVKIFPACSSEKEVQLNYCGPEGEPVERVYRVKGTDEVVEYDNLRKSYEGHMIDATELAKAESACLVDENGNDLKQINVEQFISLKDLPWERVEGRYYIGPNLKNGTAESFMTFLSELKKRKAVAVAKVVIRSRQKIFALYVKDDIMQAVCLSFKANLHHPDESELRSDVKLKKPVLDMMGALIDAQMSDASVLDEIEDTFVARKRKLVEDASKGEKVTVPDAPEKAGEDLLEQLKKSVDAATKKKEKATA